MFEVFELLYNLFLPFRLLPVLWRQPEAVLYERHAYFMFMGVLLGKWLKRPVVLEVNELAGFTRARGLIHGASRAKDRRMDVLAGQPHSVRVPRSCRRS